MILVLSVAAYDLLLWRVGFRGTWCERTQESGQEFWGPIATSPVGHQVDLTGSSDYACDACSIEFDRRPRFVLPAVDQHRTMVQPCPATSE